MTYYTSLINQLSDLDKKRIENYLHTYGNKYGNININEWLCYWDHSKQKLFKALGNTLIKEVPISFEKDEEYLEEEIKLLKFSFYDDYIFLLDSFGKTVKLKYEDYRILKDVLNTSQLINNQIYCNTKIDLGNGKIMQLQRGMKVAKIISNIYNFEKDNLPEDFNRTFKKKFEEFKRKHSIILNEKKVKGILCFSIHPLDFLTMSDNANRWSSCMSWKEDGCYRVGTIETMNSNNTVCVYLKSEQPFNFGNKEENDESFMWNNKRWRQIFYITKDIIVNGKSYPFAFEKDIQIKILTILKDMVEKNINWNYTFGPEPYRDMIHIHSKYRMDKNRNWINIKDTFKHNILFDTKAMYNDFLNDVNFNYMCFRNKVKSNKIISVSGKANCICCNGSVLRPTDYENNTDYNERFQECGNVLCKKCYDKIPVCEKCDCVRPTKNYIPIVSKTTGETIFYCEDCFKDYISTCPICGENYDREILSFIPASKALWRPLFKVNYEKNMSKFFTSCLTSPSMFNSYIEQEKEAGDKGYNLFEIAKCCVNCMFTLSKEKREIYENVELIPYRYIFTMSAKEREQKLKQYILDKRNKEYRKIIIDPNYQNKLALENASKGTTDKDGACYIYRLPKVTRNILKILDEGNKDFEENLFKKI